MLRVPAFRQADDTSCVPTCIRSVLAFHGRNVDAPEVHAWCRTTRLGSDADTAVQGLIDAGHDAELNQLVMEDLVHALEDQRPPIVVLSHGNGWLQAVVVCEIGPRDIIVMDPRVGTYVSLTRAEFELSWAAVSGESLFIGKRDSLPFVADNEVGSGVE